MAASNTKRDAAFTAWCNSSEGMAFMKEAASDAAADKWRRMSAEEKAAYQKDDKSSAARWEPPKGFGNVGVDGLRIRVGGS